MKKTLLALTTALTVLPALNVQADWTPPQLYLGAQVGGTFGHGKFDTVSTTTVGGPSNLSSSKGEAFFIGGIFAGARYFFSNYFAGIEVEGNWDGMNLDVATYESRVADYWRLHLKRQWQIIPSAVFGWKMNEKTALFAKFGAGISKFTLVEGRGQSSENATTDRIVHFVPALGLEYETHENVGVRFELSGEFFGKDVKGNSASGANLSQTTKVCYNGVSAKVGILVKV